jgi:nucleotide-binding universal stress UspA family protein
MADELALAVVVVHIAGIESGIRRDERRDAAREHPVEQRYRYALRDWYRHHVGEEPEEAVLSVGDPAETLGRLADDHSAALLILSTSGKGMARQLAVGSTALELTGAPPRPVAIVPPGEAGLPDEGTIVVGTDLTRESDIAIEGAARLARRLSWTLHIVHSSRIDNRYLREEYLPEPLKSWATARYRGSAMQKVIERCEHFLAGVEVQPRIVDDLPVRGLCQYIAHVDADLAVLGHHPRNAYSPGMLTSVALRCVRTVRSPLVVVPLQEHSDGSARRR